MITCKKRLSLFPGLALTAILGTGLLTLALPGQANATTAAYAVIRNTASVSYADAVGLNPNTVTASVDVTVNLVAVTPTLSTPADTVIPSGTTTDYAYTILNNSNGPETFNLAVVFNQTAGNITGHTEVFVPLSPITLGATTVAAAAAANATVITVPNDGSGGGADSPVNGIAVGDTVMIGASSYTVTATMDNATGTSTITLGGTGLTGPVTVGTQIGERGSFISRTTPTASVNNSIYTLTVSATGAAAAATDLTQTTVLVTAALVPTKFVRNIAVACSTGTVVTVDTGLGAGPGNYCSSGVTGNPGQTLEYLIRVSNPSGGAAATNVIISDPVPAFTTQTGNIALDPGTGTYSNVLPAANNHDFAEVVANIVYIYAGTGGFDDVANGGGSLAANTTTFGAFRVTIDN